jgi:hypothetical protein
MVLSTTSRAKSSALKNQFQGGGDKKAGIARVTSAAGRVALEERGLPQSMSFMMLPLASTTRASRGIGWKFFER